jgi:hypothetical protein
MPYGEGLGLGSGLGSGVGSVRVVYSNVPVVLLRFSSASGEGIGSGISFGLNFLILNAETFRLPCLLHKEIPEASQILYLQRDHLLALPQEKSGQPFFFHNFQLFLHEPAHAMGNQVNVTNINS